MKELKVEKNEEGRTLFKFLSLYFKGAEKGFLHKMLRKKNIVLNGKKADGTEKLKDGDVVKVFFSDETFSKMRGEEKSDITFKDISSSANHPSPDNHDKRFFRPDIIFEDDDIIAANKPPFVLSQKAKDTDVSMNEVLISYLIKNGELSDEDFRTFHPSVVNRLDRNTSGLILFGKTYQGTKYLSQALKERDIEKYYLCFVHGEMKESGIYDGVLKKEESNQVSISHLSKKEASFEKDKKIRAASYLRDGESFVKTGFTPLSFSHNVTLLKVRLYTGKTHQIRAHLKEMGYPVLFDMKYGDSSLDRKLIYEIERDNTHYPDRFIRNLGKRQYLHSYRVKLSDGREFTAPLYKDMVLFYKVLKFEGLNL